MVEHQPLHHALRGAGEYKVRPRHPPVHPLLEQARYLSRGGGEGRELVQSQDHPAAGVRPTSREERVPVRVGHVGKPGKHAADLGGESHALERGLAVVRHVVDGAVLGQGFPQETGLPTAASSVEHGEGGFASGEQAAQPGQLGSPVEERQGHRRRSPKELCHSYIMLHQQNEYERGSPRRLPATRQSGWPG